jgi:hypothetical protein
LILTERLELQLVGDANDLGGITLGDWRDLPVPDLPAEPSL